MKKVLLIIALAAAVSGCATRSQTAALAGVVTGAVIANEVNRNSAPKPVVMVPTPVVRCYNHLIGYDYWRRPVYQQVCQ